MKRFYSVLHKFLPGVSYKYNSFASHAKLLLTLEPIINGVIYELGCGYGSTPLLHNIAKRRGLRLVTIETSLDWMEKFSNKYSTMMHKFIHVENFEQFPEVIQANLFGDKLGMMFVDQGSWESRLECIEKFRSTAEYFVLHDSCHYPNTNSMGFVENEISKRACSYSDRTACACGKNGTLVRKYNILKYNCEYIPSYGPPSLLSSDSIPYAKLQAIVMQAESI